MPPETKMPDSAEIDQALKEFEIKAQTEEIQKAPEASKISDTPKVVQLVMKYSGGVVKDQRQAEYILFGFVVVAIIVSLYLFFGGDNQKAKIEAPVGQKIIYPENAPPRLEKQF